MLSRDVTGNVPVTSEHKVRVVASPSAAQQKTLLALWLSSVTFELGMFVGVVLAKSLLLGILPSTYILGLVVHILAC